MGGDRGECVPRKETSAYENAEELDGGRVNSKNDEKKHLSFVSKIVFVNVTFGGQVPHRQRERLEFSPLNLRTVFWSCNPLNNLHK